MALPYTFQNNGAVIDATQVNANFSYLDTGKPREAVVASVPANSTSTSTPTTVTYSPAFATSTDVFRGLVFVNYTGTDFPYWAYQISNITAAGFEILVSGGQTGTTVDVHYSVIGH